MIKKNREDLRRRNTDFVLGKNVPFDFDDENNSLDEAIFKMMKTLKKRINNIIKAVNEKTNFQKGDLMNIIVLNDDFLTPISTGYQKKLNAEMLLNYIENILLSDQCVDINNTTYNIKVVNIPRGQGLKKINGYSKIINLVEDKKKQKEVLHK